MAKLPTFTADGLLPPGDYELTLEELRSSALVAGPRGATSWNRAWREKLTENLGALVMQLVEVGVTDIFVDGSFVEEKAVPNDVDGYFVCDVRQWASGELQQRLQEIDSAWTWEHSTRTAFRAYPKRQLPMWHKYRVEMFPDYGQFCGILDRRGHPLTFAKAFRLSRTFRPKGIVKIGGLS